ncbi:TPA: manganese transporter [Candidatus Uhrbacteria bacterium]|nr:manganese transporter [Candidatus Uhrbacteria bacterium]
MFSMLEILSFPFMQRALVTGILIGLLLATLGIFVLMRNMAFFGDGIAHASLAGIALGILTGVAPLPVAIIYAIVVALIIYGLERSTRLSSDTIIGILFTASMALGVVLLAATPGFQPELVSFLFGNILTITFTDIVLIGSFATLILVWLLGWHRHLTYATLDPDSATIAGINTQLHTILLYIALAVSVVLGVKILGIVLISALLIIPAATSSLLTGTFKSFFWISGLLSVVVIVLGLLLSFFIDAPSGATIILVAASVFFLAALGSHLLKRR